MIGFDLIKLGTIHQNNTRILVFDFNFRYYLNDSWLGHFAHQWLQQKKEHLENITVCLQHLNTVSCF